MGVKKQNSYSVNWQSTTPIPYSPNAPLSGSTAGVMTGTETFYSNIQAITNYDNLGLEFTWTGTPTGVISVSVSESGKNFYPYPNLTIIQPTGSASGGIYVLNQVPFRYLLITYVNTSGTGSLVAWLGSKDLN